MKISHNVPEPIADALAHQYETRWIQALTDLLSYYWKGIQRLVLKPLREKTTGKIWMAYHIRKLWYTVWDMWYARKHVIHLADGPMKNSIIRKVNEGIEYNHVRGLVGPTERCRFLFNTPIYSILNCPIRKLLSWLATISSARKFSILQSSHSIISNDPLFLYRI